MVYCERTNAECAAIMGMTEENFRALLIKTLWKVRQRLMESIALDDSITYGEMKRLRHDACQAFKRLKQTLKIRDRR